VIWTPLLGWLGLSRAGFSPREIDNNTWIEEGNRARVCVKKRSPAVYTQREARPRLRTTTRCAFERQQTLLVAANRVERTQQTIQ
jgi:hypothetical protein